jgi:formate hydrogenlyase subunit 3/multisubunit Na+/H+ antiporter MnhD subunit
VFPLAHADEALRLQALTGSLVQTLSHALAKAAMFLGVGALAARAGSDRLDDLRAAPPAPILSVIALAVAGASLIGLPPSGGFRAKWLLLDTAVETGQWWWGLVILAGGALSVGYVLRALAPLIDGTGVGQTAPAAGSRTQDAIVLGLAIASLLLGFSALVPPELLLVGRAP